MAVLSMSKQEFSRLDVLLRVQSGRLRVTDACVLIGLQRRQVFRRHRQLVASGQLNLGDRQLIEIYCQHTLQISAQISNFWVLDALCSAAVI